MLGILEIITKAAMEDLVSLAIVLEIIIITIWGINGLVICFGCFELLGILVHLNVLSIKLDYVCVC